MSKITTSQTIGPFSHEAWKWASEASIAQVKPAEHSVLVSGVIYDGDGNPINDAQIEAWSPASAPAEAGQLLPGFRRVPSGAEGEFSMRLALPEPGRGEPLMYVSIFARGLVLHQFTAVFLEDDGGLTQSGILNQVPHERRATLIARKSGERQYRWNIRMQGENETVFFDYA